MLVITFLLFALKFLLLIQESYQLCIDVSPPENGKIHMDRSYNFYNISCDPGYTIKGNKKVFCVGTEWNSAPPTCVKTVCETLTHPQNGKVECDEAPLYPGKKCVYSCSEGYVLRGVPVRQCLLNSTWSGPSTLCTPQSGVFCDPPPPLENGKIIGCSPNNLPIESKKCSFQCNEGYFLEGPSSLTCRMHGKLTDNKGKEDMPVCKRKNTIFGVRHNPPRNPCLNHNCEQLCRVINGRAQCKCETGYILNTADKRTCKVNKPCRINNGGCEQLCHEKENKTVECGCKTGYIIGENRKSCIIHSTPEITAQTCEVDNGGCEHDCVGTSLTEVKCYCKTGYRLHPDGKHCIGSNNHHAPTNVTVNTDAFTATLTWLPGVAGHERIYVVWFKLADEGDNAWRTFRAYPDGATTFTLKNLQADREYDFAVLSKNKLGDNSVFSPIIKAKTKSAPTCGVDNGGCEQYCVTMRGAGVTCFCKTGYSLHPDGKHCVDIDECSNESLNQCQHLCKNNEGGYKCSCRPGYVLYDGHRCKGCRKNSYWSDELNGCVDCPRNSHTKSEGNPFIGDCVCNAGYTGNPGASVECEDIDECVENRLGCSGICVNIPGGAYCTCPSGFTLDRDNKTCIDIDECSIKNGGCEGLCRNLNGSFNCTCGNGFVTSANDSYTCDDVDECLQNNGGCEQKCVNYRGGFSCSCNAGYRLDRDFKSCNEIRCPRLPLPNYSTMNCEKNKTKLSDMDYYSIGTVCKFKCFEGYKNAKNSSEEMKCLIDGTFKGTLPKCKPKHCSPLPVPENGRLHPRYCSKEGAAVKQRCTYICNPGYEIEGQRIFICQKNVTWDGEDPPICKRVKIQPDIQCPEDIDATLSLGKASYNITVPKPSTNTEKFEVNPSWIHVGENQEFSIGVTKITFTASSSDTNDTAECVTTVTIMDKEPPVFEYCPDPIKIEGASGDGEFVTWKEPVVKDNVKLVSVFSIMKPNVTLTPGTYFVEYIAKDSSGNTASCSFGINIIAMNCSRLADPPHGESNCMDLKYGRICLPQCDFGYMRDPDAPDLYSCDDSGVWEPSDVVSECLEFSPKNSSECEEGFELKLNKENGEEVCIECSSGTAWSSASRKCEEITK